MIESYLVTNRDHDLAERERLRGEFEMDPGVAHIRIDTCNRLEFYWGQGRIPLETARHLYRVTAGLESGLLGEKAIMGQVKNAYLEACRHYQLSGGLNRLFQSAIHVGRVVRTCTAISRGAVSHSQVTVQLLESSGFDFAHKTIAILGINDLTVSILKFLHNRRTLNLLLSTRNAAKAQEMARRFGGETFPVADRQAQLHRCDCLITATRAPHFLLTAEHFSTGDRPLVIFDLSSPRTVDPAVADYPHITLYNLDDIEQCASRSRQVRREEITKADAIIEDALLKLSAWQDRALAHVNDRF